MNLDDLKLLDVNALSKVLHRSAATLKADATRRPETLPPRFQIPGTRKLLWLESDVVEWMKKLSASKTHRIR